MEKMVANKATGDDIQQKLMLRRSCRCAVLASRVPHSIPLLELLPSQMAGNLSTHLPAWRDVEDS